MAKKSRSEIIKNIEENQTHIWAKIQKLDAEWHKLEQQRKIHLVLQEYETQQQVSKSKADAGSKLANAASLQQH